VSGGPRPIPRPSPHPPEQFLPALLRRLKVLVTTNWILKLVAFALALIWWGYTVSQLQHQETVFYSLELKQPDYLAVTTHLPERIEVQLLGPKITLQQFNEEPHTLSFDLRNSPEGDLVQHLYPDSLGLPAGLQVMSIRPATITLTLEEIASKIVPLRPRFLGTPRGTLIVDTENSVVKPAQLKIYGPKSKLAAIEVVLTEDLDLSNRSSSYIENCKPVSPDPSIRLEAIAFCQVNVRLIESKPRTLIERNILNVPLQLVGAGTGFRYDLLPPTVLKVTVRGSDEAMKALRREQVQAQLDLTAWDGEPGALPPTITAPEGIEIVEYLPETIGITATPTRPRKKR